MHSLKPRGFTLIELVVVITILGILAAFAVPRFFALDREAREAAVNSLAGSLRSSSALVHGMWMAQGTNPATIAVDGQNIGLTFGYPNLATIDNTIGDLGGFGYVPATGVFTKTGAATAACTVTYTPPAAANLPPTILVNTGTVPAPGC